MVSLNIMNGALENIENYALARTWKRICARIFDIFIVSLIPGIITLSWYLINKTSVNNWISVLIMIIINFLIIIIYFLIIPWKFNGQTLGKKIFLIKLTNENNQAITFKSIFLREIFLVFIPVLLTMLAILITSLVLNANIANVDDKTSGGFWINVLVRVIFSFVFAWYLGIMITIKVDKKHQLFYDRKNHLYVINKYPIVNKSNFSRQEQNQEPIIHVHLGQDQPGKINQEELDNIQDLS
ncbi:MAG: RDD family protein [Spiroplasma sp.]|nr:RDD family protein [Spiroplasma sp.]